MDPIYSCKQVVMQDHVMLKRKKVAKTPFFFLLKRKKRMTTQNLKYHSHLLEWINYIIQ